MDKWVSEVTKMFQEVHERPYSWRIAQPYFPQYELREVLCGLQFVEAFQVQNRSGRGAIVFFW